MPTPPTNWTHWSRERLDARRVAARRSAYQPLVPVAAAVVAGVALDRFGWLTFPAGLAATIAISVWWLAARRSFSEYAAGWLLLLAVTLTAAAWHDAHWRAYASNEIGLYAARNPTPVCLEAVAIESPSIRATSRANPFRAIPQVESSRLLVVAEKLRHGDAWLAVEGRLHVLVNGHLVGVEPGDRIQVFGQLSRVPSATNPGQHDAALNHRAERRLCRVRSESPACVEVLADGASFSWRRGVDRLRRSAIGVLDRNLPRHQASLMAAMLLGDRDRVPPETIERFRRTGALHVLVVSGLHVGLVIAGLYFATRMGWLPRRGAIVAMMILAVAYAALAGGRPPVVRAVVLAEVLCVAMLMGRRIVAFNSLAAAAIVVLFINPSELFRSGTQLSFLATATLIWFGGRELQRPEADPLDRLIASVRPWWHRGLVTIGRGSALVLVATLAVWIVSAPLLAHRFHLLSPIAVPLSVGVFPLVAVSVTSGLGLLVVGMVAPWATAPFAALASGSTHALDRLLAAANETPGSSFWTPGPAWWWTVGVYALMALAVFGGGDPRWRRAVTRIGMLWLPMAFAPWLAGLTQPPRLRATFIDVGHGASVLVEGPNGGTLLYDAGSIGSPDAATETIAGVLWSRGLVRIDAVVLSHADVDHFNALPGLIERFHVGGVYVSPMMLPPLPIDADNRSAPAELRRLLAERGVPVEQLRMGDRLRVGAITAEVFHPTQVGVLGSDNTNSLVLAIEAVDKRLLLPGDLEGDGLRMLLEQERYDCDLLLAPHHGSSQSDPPGLADWCRPEWVVISGGPRSSDAGATYAASGADVLRTYREGAIAVDVGFDGRLRVSGSSLSQIANAARDRSRGPVAVRPVRPEKLVPAP